MFRAAGIAVLSVDLDSMSHGSDMDVFMDNLRDVMTVASVGSYVHVVLMVSVLLKQFDKLKKAQVPLFVLSAALSAAFVIYMFYTGKAAVFSTAIKAIFLFLTAFWVLAWFLVRRGTFEKIERTKAFTVYIIAVALSFMFSGQVILFFYPAPLPGVEPAPSYSYNEWRGIVVNMGYAASAVIFFVSFAAYRFLFVKQQGAG